MLKSKCAHFLCMASLLSFATPISAAQGDVIAYWQFEPDNLGSDSSGKLNDLNINGVNTSSDKDPRAPGRGTGDFAGNGFAQTFSDLDLSAYTALTFEWFMKAPQNGLGVVFEHSANFNSNP